MKGLLVLLALAVPTVDLTNTQLRLDLLGTFFCDQSTLDLEMDRGFGEVLDLF